MSDLSRQAIQAVDPAGMLDDVLAQHAQLDDALWRVDSAGLERQDLAGGLVVAGMGGSAVGGDLAAAAIGDRAERPLRTVRGYALDRYVGQDTLVASHRWHEAAQNHSAQRTLWSGAALRQVCAAHDAASTRRTAFAYYARTPHAPW